MIYIKFKNELNVEDEQQIISLFFKGYSYKEISKSAECSERAIQYVLKKHSIEARRKRRYTLDEYFFENIDTPEKAYFFGLLFADGYIGNNHFNNISISLKKSDADILYKFKEHISFTGNIRVNNRMNGFGNSEPVCVLSFSSKTMCEHLRKHGMTGLKKDRLKNNLDIPQNLMRHFFRGYFDGDGSIHIGVNSTTIKGKEYHYDRACFSMIGSKEILDVFVKESGISTKSKYRQSKTDYMLYLCVNGKKDTRKIFHYFYDDAKIYMPRKHNTWQTIIN